MKKLLLVLTMISALGFAKISAQITNGSFESWALDTFYFAAGTYGNLPADTPVFNNPVGWTSSNFLTDLDSVGAVQLTTQDNVNVMAGHSSSLKLMTDSLHPHVSTLPVNELFIPGFVINGTFSLGALTGSISNITPGAIKGAGQPISQRLDSFSGYYNFAPLPNPASGLNDSCVLWAVLRQGTTVVANAIFKSSDSTNGFQPFSVPFSYVSCAMPDTLVILLSSGPANLTSFLPGPKSITAGSTLWVDSLFYDTLATSFQFPPFPQNDHPTAFYSIPDTIDVLANDTACTGPPTVSIVSGPSHGTASVLMSTNEIIYTANAGYLGLDTILYKDTNAGGSADALVIIFVEQPQGISTVNEIPVSIYPVPSTGYLNIQFENPGSSVAGIYDMLGNLVLSHPLNSNTNRLNLGNLANGFYSIRIANERGEILARSTFVMTR